MTVENITEKCKKPKLTWFGHAMRPMLCRKTNTGCGIAREKKKKKPKAEMGELRQPRHESC